jgi:hypothetical protein
VWWKEQPVWKAVEGGYESLWQNSKNHSGLDANGDRNFGWRLVSKIGFRVLILGIMAFSVGHLHTELADPIHVLPLSYAEHAIVLEELGSTMQLILCADRW